MRRTATALLATVRASVPGPAGAPAGRRARRVAGGAAWAAVSAAPAVAFVVVDAVRGLTAASVALAVTAPAVFVVQLLLRRPPGMAALTLLVASVCGVVAALAGEARAFFLLPTLFPAGVVLVLLASLLLGRPLTGVLLNGLARGPRTVAAARPAAALARARTGCPVGGTGCAGTGDGRADEAG